MVKGVRAYRIAVLVVILFSAIIGGINNFAHAEPTTGDMGAQVYVDSSLTFDITPRNVELNLNSANHPFDVSQDVNIIVGTNNTTGYKLIMSSDTGTNLINTANNATIPTLPNSTTGYTENDFINNSAYNNTWGYKQDGGNYMQFKSGDPIMDNSSAADRDTTTLNFAAKIDGNQLAGTYSIRLNFEVVTNPIPNYMQNLNPSLCTTTPSTVIDTRDNQEYTIQRLADGKCWMMINLNLGATSSLVVSQLDSTNTNFTGSNVSKTILASDFSSTASDGWKKTSGSGTYTSPEYIPVDGSDSRALAPYGTLYNYCAASAGTYCYASGSGTGNATSDLCPAGWRMPTGGSSGEFRNLYTYYNSLAKMRDPISSDGAAFALAGSFQNNVPGNQSKAGYYWSSTRYGTIEMYTMSLGTTISASYQLYRTYGLSIRCMLKE